MEASQPTYTSGRGARVLSLEHADIICLLRGYEIEIGDYAWTGDPSPKPPPGWLSVQALDKKWGIVWWAFMPVQNLSDPESFKYVLAATDETHAINPRPFRRETEVA